MLFIYRYIPNFLLGRDSNTSVSVAPVTINLWYQPFPAMAGKNDIKFEPHYIYIYIYTLGQGCNLQFHASTPLDNSPTQTSPKR